MEILAIILCFLAGFMSGAVITIVVHCVRAVGDLRLDTSDPDSPFLFLELKKPGTIEHLRDEQFVTLRVNLKNYIPRK